MAGKKVLIVATSHAMLGVTGERTGVWLEELATPYYALHDAGLEVTLASVRGERSPSIRAAFPRRRGRQAVSSHRRGQRSPPRSGHLRPRMD